MRILSRKIWRAFPELDRFDNETCRCYVARARSMRGQLFRVLTISMASGVGFVLAVLVEEPSFQVLVNLTEKYGPYPTISVMAETTIETLLRVNYVLTPWVIGYYARDFLLERCIKKQLKDSCCHQCGYNMIGLTIYGEQDDRRVRCPECGSEIILRVSHLTEADIDPTLLAQSKF